MAIAKFQIVSFWPFWLEGQWLVWYTAQFDPFLSLDCALPCPQTQHNPRKGRDQILPSGNLAFQKSISIGIWMRKRMTTAKWGQRELMARNTCRQRGRVLSHPRTHLLTAPNPWVMSRAKKIPRRVLSELRRLRLRARIRMKALCTNPVLRNELYLRLY